MEQTANVPSDSSSTMGTNSLGNVQPWEQTILILIEGLVQSASDSIKSELMQVFSS